MPTLEARMLAIAQKRLLYRRGIVIIYSRCEERRGRQQTKTSSSVTEPGHSGFRDSGFSGRDALLSAGFIRPGNAPYSRSKEILGSLQPGMAGFRRKQ